MPQPEFRGLTGSYSPLLTTLAISYLGGIQEDYVGRRLFPGVPTANSFGIYKKIPRGSFLRSKAKKLANNEAAPIGGFDYAEDNFSVDTYGIAANWTDKDLNAAQVGGIGAANLVRHKTLYVTQQAMLRLEQDTATLTRNFGSWSTNYTGIASGGGAPTSAQFIKWSDYLNSDPVSDFKRWKESMKLATGYDPNKFLLTRAPWRILSEHPDIIDRIKYTGTSSAPAKVSLQTVAALFEIDEIIVPGGVINSAEEGQPDAVDWIWGADCWLGYTTAAPSIDNPSAGYHFNWTGAGMGTSPAAFQGQVNDEGMHIRQYTENRPAAYFVESNLFTTPKVTATDLGNAITSVI